MGTDNIATANLRQAQQFWAQVTESYIDSMGKFGQPVAHTGLAKPDVVLDQVFDFWEKSLQIQRDWTKKLTSVAVAAGESAQAQAEISRDSVRSQVAATADAVRDRALQVYDGMTRAELKAELALRELTQSGNLAELRERLVDDDTK